MSKKIDRRYRSDLIGCCHRKEQAAAGISRGGVASPPRIRMIFCELCMEDKMNRKAISAVLSGTMLLSLMAGSMTTVQAAGKTKLTLWHIQTGEMANVIQGSVDRFMEANPDYDVEVVQKQNDTFKTDVSLAAQAGTLPDIFITWGGQTMYDYADQGLIADLTEYMNKDNYKDQFVDAGIAQCTYKDKIWAVPVENISVAGIFYNKDVFDKYNLEEPKTLDDLEKICDTLVENGVAPFALANATKWTGSMFFQYLATRYGGLEPFADAAAGKGSFENDAFEFAGTKIQDWVDKGYFCDGFNGMDDDSGQARALFYTGSAAMDLMGSWFTMTIAGENKQFLDDGKLGFFPFPEIPDSKADQSLCLGTIGDNLYVVSNKCADKEAAFKVIQSLLDDEAVKERTDLAKIIPLKSFKTSDPVVQEVLDTISKAKGIQLWYDQYLPSEVAEVHKATSQEIFGKTITPAEADKELQDAMTAYLSKKGTASTEAESAETEA